MATSRGRTSRAAAAAAAAAQQQQHTKKRDSSHAAASTPDSGGGGGGGDGGSGGGDDAEYRHKTAVLWREMVTKFRTAHEYASGIDVSNEDKDKDNNQDDYMTVVETITDDAPGSDDRIRELKTRLETEATQRENEQRKLRQALELVTQLITLYETQQDGPGAVVKDEDHDEDNDVGDVKGTDSRSSPAVVQDGDGEHDHDHDDDVEESEDNNTDEPPLKKRKASASSSSSSSLPPPSSKKITVGSQVAFRMAGGSSNSNGPPTGPSEEEWIQCEVVRAIVDGVKYEVQDPEPDEQGNPGQRYRARVRDLLAIPHSNASSAAAWPHLGSGSQVLARYPETTTFYRAEVSHMLKNKCRLVFEGEEEEGKETEVERRLVLPIPK